MAELIGGGTVHTWGVIPANKTQAAAKHGSKDVDWDQLFENCLSMRWLIIDECSTLGALVCGVFDGNMRRARKRQPYAKRGDGTARPFGGVNMTLAGDFWQLPPVRAIGFYSDPFHTDLEFVEQRAMNYFWRRNEDCIDGLFELVVSQRQKDRHVTPCVITRTAGALRAPRVA